MVRVPANVTSVVIAGLEVFTIYAGEVIAESDFGLGPSATFTVATPQSPPAGAVVNASVVLDPRGDVQALNATWQAPPLRNPTIVLQGYRVSLKIVDINGPLAQPVVVANVTLPANATLWQQTNILSGADFVLQIAALTSVGPGSLVEIPFSVLTGPNLTDIAVVSATSVNVPFGSPPSRRAGGPQSFNLYFRTRQGDALQRVPSGQILLSNSSSGQLQFAVSGLSPFTAYEYFVSAVTAVGETVLSNSKAVLTPESEPTAPPIMQSIQAVSSTSINVTWAPPPVDKRNGVILSYTLYFQRAAVLGTIANAVSPFLLTGLARFANYSISVSARTSVGEGPRSNATVVRTLEDLPGAPAINFTTGVNSTAITVSWRPPVTPNGVIVS